jgi:methionyl-tRNA formyltransferase
MGSPEFALPSLRALVTERFSVVGVYTQPDRAAGRGRHLAAPPVKQYAESVGLPVFQPASLRQPQALADLQSLAPDLIVIAAYGQILRPRVLAIPPRGTLNVHASLLPRYRGASPVATAILDGAELTGVSIMLVDEGLDTGPVLAEREMPIQPQDTTGSLSARLAALGAALLVDVLPEWLTGRVEPRPQDASRATLTKLIRKEDGILNWQQPASTLWRRIRAYSPWPGATTTVGGSTVQILQSWPVEGTCGGAPGSVSRFRGPLELPPGLPRPAFAVQTGSGLLVPLMLQTAGKQPVTAIDFLNGQRGLLERRFGT